MLQTTVKVDACHGEVVRVLNDLRNKREETFMFCKLDDLVIPKGRMVKLWDKFGEILRT